MYKLKKVVVYLILISGFFVVAKLFWGGFLINPFLGIYYKTPHYESYLNDYQFFDIYFSPNTPFAVFNYKPNKNFNANPESYYKSGIGVIDLQTYKSIVLTSNNGIESSKSLFSPNGNKILYPVAKDKNTSWAFNLNMYDINTGISTKVNNGEYLLGEKNRFEKATSVSTEPQFGWLNNETIFYYCSGTGGLDNAYCLVDLNSGKITRYRFGIDDYGVKLRTASSIISNYYISETNSNKRNNSYNFDKTMLAYNHCLYGVYDGCGMMILKLKTSEFDRFILNYKDYKYRFGLNELYWSYDNHLYLLNKDSADSLHTTTSGLIKLY